MRWLYLLIFFISSINIIDCNSDSNSEHALNNKDWIKIVDSLEGREKCETERNNDRVIWLETLKTIQSQLADVLVENKQLKTDIELLKRRTNGLEFDNKFLKDEIELMRGDGAYVMKTAATNKSEYAKPGQASGDLSVDEAELKNIEMEPHSMTVDTRINRASSVQRSRRFENDLGVAFYAVMTHHLEHVGANQTIVFDLAITNVGNGYSIYSGDFRAPVAGTYSFSTTLRDHGTHEQTRYYIAKNNDHVGNLANMGHISLFSSYSMTVVLQLKQGDTISIRNVDTDKTLNGNYYSVFSGFLLQEDYTGPDIIG
ncbi:hypothetical protein ACF0H5_020660 [Mactra antiquata]